MCQAGMRTSTTPPWLIAICDRIIYDAYTLKIEGESMRKRNGIRPKPNRMAVVHHTRGRHAPCHDDKVQ